MENDHTTTQIRTVLTSEVKFVIGVVMFVVGGVAPYYAMRQDIALIQKDISNINSNHEVHIQDIVQQLKEMKQDSIVQQNQIIELQKQLIALTSRK